MTDSMNLETYMTSYRYLVVIAGLVSADRLNTFLTHSGAVILLQETDFVYHYSSLLKPWVHYGEFIPRLFYPILFFYYTSIYFFPSWELLYLFLLIFFSNFER